MLPDHKVDLVEKPLRQAIIRLGLTIVTTALLASGQQNCLGGGELEHGSGQVGGIISKELHAKGCKIDLLTDPWGTAHTKWAIARNSKDVTIWLEGKWAENLLSAFKRVFGEPAHMASPGADEHLFFAYSAKQCGVLVSCRTRDLSDAGLKGPLTELGLHGDLELGVGSHGKSIPTHHPDVNIRADFATTNSAIEADLGLDIREARPAENGRLDWTVVVTNFSPHWVIVSEASLQKVLYGLEFLDGQSNVWRIPGLPNDPGLSIALQKATASEFTLKTQALERAGRPTTHAPVPAQLSYSTRQPVTALDGRPHTSHFCVARGTVRVTTLR